MEQKAYYQLGVGNHTGVITDAKVIQPRFENSSARFEVKISAVTNDYGKADIYMEMSEDYAPDGTPRYQLALNTLAELGLQDSDMTKLNVLKGKPISFFGKESKSGHINFYVSKNFDVEIDNKDANDMLASMLGKSGSGAANPSGGAFDPFGGNNDSDDIPDDVPF
ncbi:MAG: hypothetical protein PHV82_18150 [Victivallaceae bacterium]|nr:hypothetical protein [Victivallaceae bacterium]